MPPTILRCYTTDLGVGGNSLNNGLNGPHDGHSSRSIVGSKLLTDLTSLDGKSFGTGEDFRRT